MKTYASLAVALVLLASRPIQAQDIEMRQGEARLTAQEVDVEIHQRLAVTRMTQVFENPTTRNGDGIYTFALPAEASLTDFQMWIGNRIMKGEMLDRGQATRTYEQIVSKLRDPGVVEQISDRVFRVRVFPVPPNGAMKFQLTYVEMLPLDDASATYTLPLKISKEQAIKLDRFELRARIYGVTEVKDVKSSSHTIDVARKSPHEVHLGMDRRGGALDKDFKLSYRIAGQELDLALMTHRLVGEDGHFALVITPNVLKARPLPKEVVYLVDVSGSIDKAFLEEVKRGVSASIKNLSADDRFNILAFNTQVARFAAKSVPPTEESMAAGLKFLSALSPEGRTDFSEALAALGEASSERPRLVLLISDGTPSAGDLSGRAILSKSLEKLDRNTVFFGLRLGPATPERILETLSERTGGVTVGLSEAKETGLAMALMHRRISMPVMTDVSIEFGDADVYAAHPDALRVIFAQDQPTVVGRYKKAGPHKVTLKGTVEGKPVSITKELPFAEEEKGWGIAAFLWAGAEIREKLASIATSGDSTELANAIVRLSKSYRIVTPYTAFLVLENDQMYAQFGLDRTIEQERRLFKRRKKRVEEEPARGGLDLPTASPTLKPVDPLKTSAVAVPTLISSLKWLSTAQSKGLWSPATDIGLTEVGTTALTLLAYTGAYDYDLQFADQAFFEAAVRETIASLAKMQDPSTGLIGDARGATFVLNHALAAHALAELYAQKRDPRVREMLQKALAWLSDHPAQDGGWSRSGQIGNGDLRTTAFALLALSAAKPLGLEFEAATIKSADKFLESVSSVSAVYDTRAQGTKGSFYDALYIMARMTIDTKADRDDRVKAAAARLPGEFNQFDPVVAYFGTVALLKWNGSKTREWAAWARILENHLRKQDQVIEAQGSWLPKAWKEESRAAATALRALITEAYACRND